MCVCLDCETRKVKPGLIYLSFTAGLSHFIIKAAEPCKLYNSFWIFTLLKKSQTVIFPVTIRNNMFLIGGHGLGPLSGIFQGMEYSFSDGAGSCIGEDSSWVPVRIMHI